MGWYDAYRPTNVSSVNVGLMTTNDGNAAKGLGDAFTNIGDSILDANKARENKKLADKTLEATNYKLKKLKDADNQKSINNAYESDAMNYKTKQAFDKHIKADKVGGFELASPSAKNTADDWFAKQEGNTQSNFNDAVVEKSVTGGYADMKSFINANPELVKKSDGTTLKKISEYFSKRTKDSKDAPKGEDGLDTGIKIQRFIDKSLAKKTDGFGKVIIDPTELPLRTFLQHQMPLLIDKGYKATDALDEAHVMYKKKLEDDAKKKEDKATTKPKTQLQALLP